MVRYELKKGRIEQRYRYGNDFVKSLTCGCTIGVDQDPELLATFDSLEEALAELENYTNDCIAWVEDGCPFKVCIVEEVYVEVVIVDEDGDFLEYVEAHTLELDTSRIPE